MSTNASARSEVYRSSNRSQEKFPALTRIDTVSGMTVEEARRRPKFGDLTPLFPDERLPLEVPGQPNHVLARIIDLIAPIGKGQRGLIVSPPKAGKTTVLKQLYQRQPRLVASVSATTRPPLSRSAREQSWRMLVRSWLTKSTVRP